MTENKRLDVNKIDDLFVRNELIWLYEENEQLKQDIEYLEEKIKENEWHWNTIDEDRDVWHYKCNQAEKQVKELEEDLNDALNRIEEMSIDVQLLKEENENLKKENELKGDFRNFINEDIVRIKNENEQLKKDRFICLNCEHSGYTEIGCLCEKKDCWTEYKTECEDYKELKYDW